MRRGTARFILTSWVLAAPCGIVLAQGDRPNVIVILMDDFGYNDLGVQTHPNPTNYYPTSGPPPAYNITPPVDPDLPAPNHARLLTPAIDAMAAQGLRMTTFYSSPKCSPTRASLLTGRYDARVSINDVFFPGTSSGFNTHEVTLPELLRQNGYATGMIGKWHLGYFTSAANPLQLMPLRHGFEEFLGVPHSNDMNEFGLFENETLVDADMSPAAKQATLTWRYTERALDFIQRASARERPFFLYLAHSMPHIPAYPSDQTHQNADGTVWPQFKGASGVSSYYDVVMEVDHSVNRILGKLRDLGLDERTLVIFTSDNGPWQRYSNVNLTQNSVGSAYPLRDSKFSTWEGGVRVPFIARWPGSIPAGLVSDEVGGIVDLLPTLIGLAGGVVPVDRTIDGIDLWPAWSAQGGWTNPRPAYAVFEGNGTLGAVRQGSWKLRGSQLYDLSNDIQESTDVSTSNAAIKATLQGLAAAITASIAAEKEPRGVFTSFEVELGTATVWVAEGGTADFAVRLSANPGSNVTVTVGRFSGDTNLSVAAGASLGFSSAIWSNWQVVTLAAFPDADEANGGATFRVTSDAINAVREVFAFEVDDEATAASVTLVWPRSNPALVADRRVGLVGEGEVRVLSQTNPPGSTFDWRLVSGPAPVVFTDPVSNKTGMIFGSNGTYRLRLTGDHPAAEEFGSLDFTCHVGVHSASAVSLSPALDYDATWDSDGDLTWENRVSAGLLDWTLASTVVRTSVDPAPNLWGLEAAWRFGGGAIPAGGVSQALTAYGTNSGSIEVWFKPGCVTCAVKQVIWEAGGDIGASLVRDGNLLHFAVDDGAGDVLRGALLTVPMTPSSARDGFLHAVGVMDLEQDSARLYLDSSLIATGGLAAVSNWCGSSRSGIATIGASTVLAESTTMNDLGGNDLLTGSYGTFSGMIAVVRFYSRALDAAEVTELFSAYQPDNVGPAISNVSGQTFAFTAGLNLMGAVLDDGLPLGAAVTSQWRLVEGPAAAALLDAGDAHTRADVVLPGEYTFRLEADDTEVRTYSDASFTVLPLSYAEWATNFTFPPLLTGFDHDADGDGWANGIEFALDVNPVQSGASPDQAWVWSVGTATNGEPYISTSAEFPRDRAPVIGLQQSGNLAAWTACSGVATVAVPVSELREHRTYVVVHPGPISSVFQRLCVAP